MERRVPSIQVSSLGLDWSTAGLLVPVSTGAGFDAMVLNTRSGVGALVRGHIVKDSMSILRHSSRLGWLLHTGLQGAHREARHWQALQAMRLGFDASERRFRWLMISAYSRRGSTARVGGVGARLGSVNASYGCTVGDSGARACVSQVHSAVAWLSLPWLQIRLSRYWGDQLAWRITPLRAAIAMLAFAVYWSFGEIGDLLRGREWRRAAAWLERDCSGVLSLLSDVRFGYAPYGVRGFGMCGSEVLELFCQASEGEPESSVKNSAAGCALLGQK